MNAWLVAGLRGCVPLGLAVFAAAYSLPRYYRREEKQLIPTACMQARARTWPQSPPRRLTTHPAARSWGADTASPLHSGESEVYEWKIAPSCCIIKIVTG